MTDTLTSLLPQLAAGAAHTHALGFSYEALDGDSVTLRAPYRDDLVGDPGTGVLAGGLVTAMLELTATAQLVLLHPRARLPRPINVTVAYLRSGKPVDTFARAHVSKAGRRVANVTAEAWQDERGQPIATLTAHFLLDNPRDET